MAIRQVEQRMVTHLSVRVRMMFLHVEPVTRRPDYVAPIQAQREV